MDEKPKRGEEPYTLKTYPCPVCGGTHFTWGTPGSNGGVYFVPEGKLFGFGGGKGLMLRECNQCGNVLWFTKE